MKVRYSYLSNNFQIVMTLKDLKNFVSTGDFTLGKLQKFERSLLNWLELMIKGVNSGTDAIKLS